MARIPVTEEAPLSAAGASAPGSHVVRGAWWASILTWLDTFISETMLRASPLELSRARLVAGGCWVMLVANVVFLFTVPLTPHPWSIGMVAGGCAVGIVSSLSSPVCWTFPSTPSWVKGGE